jgi:hypothetical protein
MDFKFKEDAEVVSSSELYYDLFDRGYISPTKFLADQAQIDLVNEAISVVEDFLSSAEDIGLIEVY